MHLVKQDFSGEKRLAQALEQLATADKCFCRLNWKSENTTQDLWNPFKGPLEPPNPTLETSSLKGAAVGIRRGPQQTHTNTGH